MLKLQQAGAENVHLGELKGERAGDVGGGRVVPPCGECGGVLADSGVAGDGSGVVATAVEEDCAANGNGGAAADVAAVVEREVAGDGAADDVAGAVELTVPRDGAVQAGGVVERAITNDDEALIAKTVAVEGAVAGDSAIDYSGIEHTVAIDDGSGVESVVNIEHAVTIDRSLVLIRDWITRASIEHAVAIDDAVGVVVALAIELPVLARCVEYPSCCVHSPYLPCFKGELDRRETAECDGA